MQKSWKFNFLTSRDFFLTSLFVAISSSLIHLVHCVYHECKKIFFRGRRISSIWNFGLNLLAHLARMTRNPHAILEIFPVFSRENFLFFRENFIFAQHLSHNKFRITYPETFLSKNFLSVLKKCWYTFLQNWEYSISLKNILYLYKMFPRDILYSQNVTWLYQLFILLEVIFKKNKP